MTQLENIKFLISNVYLGLNNFLCPLKVDLEFTKSAPDQYYQNNLEF